MNEIVKILQAVEENTNSAFFYTPPVFENANSYLFLDPAKIIELKDKNYSATLDEIERARAAGLIGYGLISYEFGYLLEEKLASLLDKNNSNPLIKFCFFEPKNVIKLSWTEMEFNGVPEALRNKNYSIENFGLNISKDQYVNDIKKVRRYIEEGDTYQVNYTTKGKFKLSGDPKALFLNFIFNQSAEYTAFINAENEYIISASPELFFQQIEDRIIAKPMKGTIGRGKPLAEDEKLQTELFKSEKDRAENVMIVDLLRNDIGRISKLDTVKVDSLFDIQKYESLFQMTSTVSASLGTDDKPKLKNIIENIFPCGSITGAPKIRTMEIINELEEEPRDIYTGAIGIVEPGRALFNVAIRTVKIDKKNKSGELGIGAGIVWDSEPEKEYNETLLKGSFLTNPSEYFEIFETLLYEQGEYFLLEKHIDRIAKAAEFFLFHFDREKFELKLKGLELNFEKSKSYKVRISLNKWGIFSTEYETIAPNINQAKTLLAQMPINSGNKYLYFKTTARETYNSDLINARSDGYSEVIYLNEYGELTEGTFTNIFVKLDGTWYTPPVDSGILNGCFREHLLETENHSEKKIMLEDILKAEQIKIVNSVRKEIRVSEIWYMADIIFKSK